MSTDLVVDEAELKYMADKLQNYGEFLVDVMKSYMNAIDYINKNALSSSMARVRLESLKNSVMTYYRHLPANVKEITKQVNVFTDHIKSQDNFKF